MAVVVSLAAPSTSPTSPPIRRVVRREIHPTLAAASSSAAVPCAYS